MADTTVRTLRLLTLLQRRRYWSGPELAERLEVSERTLRRDVLRLRELGYSIHTDRGVNGGYQLESTSELAPVLVDNDEAVALAVGLNLAAQGSPELAEIAIGALSKLLSLLPPEQRRRAETIRAVTSAAPGFGRVGPELDVLAVVAAACRDGVRLSFHYRAADGAESDRYIEAYGLVALGANYYLVGFDIDRDDWRIFRLDRLSDPRPARAPFDPRPLPDEDLRSFVVGSLRGRDTRYRIVVDIERSADELRAEYGRWTEIEKLGIATSRVTMHADTFVWPLRMIAGADADFTVVEPDEFRQHVASAGERLVRSARPGRRGTA